MNCGQHVPLSRMVLSMFAQGANVTKVNLSYTLQEMICTQECATLLARNDPS